MLRLFTGASKVRGERRTAVRHSDQLQNKLLNFYHLQPKLPSSASVSSELFSWQHVLKAVPRLWTSFFPVNGPEWSTGFMENQWCDLYDVSLAWEGKTAVNPAVVGKTPRKINDFLSSASDTSRKNMRRRPKQPCHQITYSYTSRSEVCQTQCQAVPWLWDQHHPPCITLACVLWHWK